MEPETSRSEVGTAGCEISIPEVCALVDYTIREGKDQDVAVVGLLMEELAAHSENRRPSLETLHLYAKLCVLTRLVNGRTLRETTTKNLVWGAFGGISAYTLLFLTLALGAEILSTFFADFPAPEKGAASYPWFLLYQYGLDPLRPLFWGGLGSCVFLLKRLSDFAADSTYTRDKIHGWNTRILLGAVLGGILQYIFVPKVQAGGGTEAVQLGANAVAFLAGVGVKVVYGAIEKTVDLLADKLNLSSLRTAKANPPDIAGFLMQELARADPTDPAQAQRIKLLREMIDTAGNPRTA
jgi:hypothetical protein